MVASLSVQCGDAAMATAALLRPGSVDNIFGGVASAREHFLQQQKENDGPAGRRRRGAGKAGKYAPRCHSVPLQGRTNLNGEDHWSGGGASVAQVRELARMSLAARHQVRKADRQGGLRARPESRARKALAPLPARERTVRPDSGLVRKEVQLEIRKKRDRLSQLAATRKAKKAQLADLQDQAAHLAATAEAATPSDTASKQLVVMSAKLDDVALKTDQLGHYGQTLALLAERAGAKKVEWEQRLVLAKEAIGGVEGECASMRLVLEQLSQAQDHAVADRSAMALLCRKEAKLHSSQLLGLRGRQPVLALQDAAGQAGCGEWGGPDGCPTAGRTGSASSGASSRGEAALAEAAAEAADQLEGRMQRAMQRLRDAIGVVEPEEIVRRFSQHAEQLEGLQDQQAGREERLTGAKAELRAVQAARDELLAGGGADGACCTDDGREPSAKAATAAARDRLERGKLGVDGARGRWQRTEAAAGLARERLIELVGRFATVTYPDATRQQTADALWSAPTATVLAELEVAVRKVLGVLPYRPRHYDTTANEATSGSVTADQPSVDAGGNYVPGGGGVPEDSVHCSPVDEPSSGVDQVDVREPIVESRSDYGIVHAGVRPNSRGVL